MAVDSKHKRFSMMRLGVQTLGPLPAASYDSSVDAADRLAFLALYSGIAASTGLESESATSAGRLVFCR